MYYIDNEMIYYTLFKHGVQIDGSYTLLKYLDHVKYLIERGNETFKDISNFLDASELSKDLIVIALVEHQKNSETTGGYLNCI